ncbi:hypothetical protein HFO42_29735 [Rhizobium leguminosarum]|jgi:hypothetical protein|uniref:Uncharacterized protein n=1 Tax=Rhizobium leguminosarum TaxID=384 RepID=A0AAJ1ADP8_RHILE|nr:MULTISPECIES: hypothetical protein [Rhizobium]MBY3122272.1 hypothetical protein [Rhizobium laguerreae]MBY3131243.1 hypothetical protein [Rhizobium laguerreae]MBY3178970.1 hypothetical protein [Rhizobium leguminosarum]MBY3192674.1 hypothetical protein [Rhizobium laguerreae]MBY3447578.1 hypothetical protein [Rhizobium laguerreae]
MPRRKQQHQPDNRGDQRDLRRRQIGPQQLDQRIGTGKHRKGKNGDTGGTPIGAS